MRGPSFGVINVVDDVPEVSPEVHRTLVFLVFGILEPEAQLDVEVLDAGDLLRGRGLLGGVFGGNFGAILFTNDGGEERSIPAAPFGGGRGPDLGPRRTR